MTIWAVSLLRSELSPGFLTAAVRVSGIRSLVENPTVAREFSSSSSTSRPYFRDASPQAISERTSYRRTRLEFLLYTQVIPECCTARGFGPPPRFIGASPCSYVARPASGLVHAIINALIRLAFTTPPEALFLRRPRRANSLARSAKSTPSPRTNFKYNPAVIEKRKRSGFAFHVYKNTRLFQKLVRGSDSSLATWFQKLFHLPHRDAFHLSLTVLVHYRS